MRATTECRQDICRQQREKLRANTIIIAERDKTRYYGFYQVNTLSGRLHIEGKFRPRVFHLLNYTLPPNKNRTRREKINSLQ